MERGDMKTMFPMNFVRKYIILHSGWSLKWSAIFKRSWVSSIVKFPVQGYWNVLILNCLLKIVSWYSYPSQFSSSLPESLTIHHFHCVALNNPPVELGVGKNYHHLSFPSFSRIESFNPIFNIFPHCFHSMCWSTSPKSQPFRITFSILDMNEFWLIFLLPFFLLTVLLTTFNKCLAAHHLHVISLK